MPHVLIIEDDPAIVMGLRDAFEAESFTVTTAQDGEVGLAAALNKEIDCILLDIMLPSMNGRDVCKNIRSRGIGTPIMMLTSKNEEADIILGLEIGADDYLTKPFRLAELLARVRALIRRKQALSNTSGSILGFGTAKIDFDRLEASKDGLPVKMSVREFEVLKFLSLHEGAIVTRDMLLNEVWGYDVYPTTRTIDNYILMLRKKLEPDPSVPAHIATVHSMGYRFTRSATTT